jgi:hypothetical protein
LLQHQRLSYGAGSGATRILPTDLSNGETDDPSHKRAVFGLSALMRLFCLIDETVIGCWSDTNHQPEDCGLTRDKVINLQRELDRALDTSQTALSKSSMATGDVSEIRKADLLVTQQWLKNRVWKLSLSHNFVEVGSRVAELSAVYPVAIGNATLSSCLALSMRSAEANGLAWVRLTESSSIASVTSLTTHRWKNCMTSLRPSSRFTRLIPPSWTSPWRRPPRAVGRLTRWLAARHFSSSWHRSRRSARGATLTSRS